MSYSNADAKGRPRIELSREVTPRLWINAHRVPCLMVYKVANPGWSISRNVYREVLTDRGVGRTIGVGVVLNRWCVSLQWRRP